MKSMLIAVAVVGIAVAGLILYLSNETDTSGQSLINVDDGTPVPR